MRGRGGGDDGLGDSMDMLLDAMCNTLGSLLFIALLLGVLSFMMGRVPMDPADEAMARRVRELERQLLSAQDDLDGARATRKAFSAASRALEGINARNKEHLEEWRRHTEKAALLRAENGRLRASIADCSRKINALPAPPIGLDDPTPPRRRWIRLPILHQTESHPLYVLMRWGRIYPVFSIDRAGGLHPNTELCAFGTPRFFESAAWAERTTVEPLRGRGLTVGSEGSPSDELRRWVEDVRRSGRFVDFNVYGDSFEEVVLARDFLAERGINYNWSPWEDGETFFLLRSGTPLQLIQ